MFISVKTLFFERRESEKQNCSFLDFKLSPCFDCSFFSFGYVTPGTYPKEKKLKSKQGESLKSRICHLYGEDSSRYIRLFEKLRIRHNTLTPGTYPKEKKLQSKHGVSLKSRICHLYGEDTSRYIRLFEKLRIKHTTLTPGTYPKEKKVHNCSS